MRIPFYKLTFGADPELFLSKDGEIIGAEKVIPKHGLQLVNEETGEEEGDPIVIIDGVQAELNPTASSCRESFSYSIKACFEALHTSLQNTGAKAEFKQTIEVSKNELKSLAAENQVFGCSPSNNAYEESKITVEAKEYPYRSAGGHIHFGENYIQLVELYKTPEDVIKILDIVLGNTCVLLDRDPGNIERRKVYGRAGEFRTPKHGLEYRTLSNFWLKHYVLTSFVLSMGRLAVCIAADPKAKAGLLELVDMKQIRTAINTNDFDLAYKNFDAIKDFLSKIQLSQNGIWLWTHPMQYLAQFEVMIKNGIDHYFKQDPMEYWINHEIGTGAENFLAGINVKDEKVPVEIKTGAGIAIVELAA